MKKRLFPFLIALAALAVSGSAAFYSVFGLSHLFAGASFEVIIMAGSLEFAKLVVASLLYQYWDTINKILKGYLLIACFILMVITSGGIYGFLSGAYQETATKSELLDKSLAIVNQKQIRFEEQKADLTLEKTQLNKSISELRISLSNPTSVSYYDKEAEQVITTTSSSTRRALQAELKSTIEDRDNINLKLEAILDSISVTDMALLDKEINNEAERELGPLKYLAETTGYPMGQVVNWFLLMIIFVFDPLAIALVVSANMAFAQIKKKDSDIVMSVPPGLKFNTPYTMDEIKDAFEKDKPSEELKQRVKENQDKLKSKDLPNMELEEEIWIPEKEENEGKALAKGLDTFIEVLEEEEKEKKPITLGKKRETKEEIKEIDSIKETPKAESNDDEHKFYHGTSKIESGVTRRGTSKKRTKKKGKPPGHIKNWTNV